MKKQTENKTKLTSEVKKDKSVVFTVKERVILADMVSVKQQGRGTFLEMLVFKHLMKKIEFSSKEVDELEFKNVKKKQGEREVVAIEWNFEKSKDYNKEISFTTAELSEIDKLFRTQGQVENSMTLAHIALWEKFDFDFKL
jgi:hypothetical protein